MLKNIITFFKIIQETSFITAEWIKKFSSGFLTVKWDSLLEGHTAQYIHHKYKLQLYIMVWEHTRKAKTNSSLQLISLSLLMTSDWPTNVLPQVYHINALYFSSLGSSSSFFLLHCHSLALSALLSLLTLLQRVWSSLIWWGWAPGSMTKGNKSQWPRVHFHSLTPKSKLQQDYAPPQFTLRNASVTGLKKPNATEVFVTPFQHCTLMIYSVSGSGTGTKYISTTDYLKSLIHLSFSHTSIIHDLWENTNQGATFYYHYYCCSFCF